MDKAVLLQAIEYLKAYKSELYAASGSGESNLEALSKDFYYRDRLEQTIYFLVQIYFNYKEN